MSSALFIGSNLAVLVGALQAAESGRRTILLTDGRPVGGHFAGINLAGHQFDIGMVLLETAESVEPEQNLHGYRPDVRNDWTRFGATVRRWLESVTTLRRTPTPTCLLDGRTWPDFLLANRLDAFAALQAAPPRPLDRSDPRHAANKVSSPAYDSLAYADAASLNHGTELHERCIEPFTRKLLGAGSTALLARYHRAAWVPLYYPETVTAALRGDVRGLAEYPFWTSEDGSVGRLVQQVAARLAEHPMCTVVEGRLNHLHPDGARVAAGVEDDGRWSGERVVLGLPLERCESLLGLPSTGPTDAASVTLLFCLVRGHALQKFCGCLSVVDECYATYRLTDQDALAGRTTELHRVVLEASPDDLARLYGVERPEEALLRELGELLDVDVQQEVQVLKVLSARGAVQVPTVDSVASLSAASERLSTAAPDAVLTGALLGYGATSFNDQVVQGLQAAREFG